MTTNPDTPRGTLLAAAARLEQATDDANRALAVTFREVAWALSFDEHLVARVGYPELVTTARAVLGQPVEIKEGRRG